MSTASYDPETIETLQRALDLAWDGLAPERRLHTSRLDLAERILVLAARGERDLARLTAVHSSNRFPPATRLIFPRRRCSRKGRLRRNVQACRFTGSKTA